MGGRGDTGEGAVEEPTDSADGRERGDTGEGAVEEPTDSADVEVELR